jgi:hypothetical protein
MVRDHAARVTARCYLIRLQGVSRLLPMKKGLIRGTCFIEKLSGYFEMDNFTLQACN